MFAVPSCFRFETQVALRAFSRACANTGKRIAAKIAMIAITTSSSMRVKPERRCLMVSILSGSWRRAGRGPDDQRRGERDLLPRHTLSLVALYGGKDHFC